MPICAHCTNEEMNAFVENTASMQCISTLPARELSPDACVGSPRACLCLCDYFCPWRWLLHIVCLVLQDARRARQEARAVRMELAQSQSIRAQVKQAHALISAQ